MTAAAVPATHHPAHRRSAPTTLHRRRIRPARVTIATAAVLAAGLVGALGWQWSAPLRHAGPTTPEVVTAALAGAAQAQEDQRALHGAYTTSREQLVTLGWTPLDDVDVTLVSASEDAFCIAAGPVAAAPVAWITQAGVQLVDACR